MSVSWAFRDEANDIARCVRRELRLLESAPLNSFRLAEHLCIPVLSVAELYSQLPHLVPPDDNRYRSGFSAVTVFHGCERLIVHNEHHERPRQHSNIAHELAHALLLHEPHQPFDEDGVRTFDAQMEAEAHWLGPALLVSEQAAISIVRRGISIKEAMDEYEVSEELMRFRLNVTGARKRGARSA